MSTLICMTMDACEDGQGARWSYLDRLEEIREQLSAVAKQRGLQFKMTWFPRADKAIERELGSVTAIVQNAAFKRFHALGDEIGWHPHFEDGVQSKDGRANGEEAREVLLAVRKLFPDIETSRVGRLFMDNEQLAAFCSLGIKQDANCLPGRKESREDMTFDWSTSGTVPYKPGKKDYRVEQGETYDLVEFPYTMLPIKTSYDKETVRRYANITFHPELFMPGLQGLPEDIIVLIAHPYELLPHDASQLVSFDMAAAIKNFEAVLDYYGNDVRFVTLREAGEVFR